MRFRTFLLTALLTALVPLRGYADDAVPSGARRSTYEEARAALKAGDLKEAERLFGELWREARTYDVAFNLGEVCMKLGRYREAAEHIAFGLRNTPPREELAFTERFTLALAAAKSQVGSVRLVVEPAGAEVFVDGELRGKAPLEGEIYLEPGAHEIRVEQAGYAPARRALDAVAGEAQELEIALVERSTPAAEPPPPAHQAAHEESPAGASSLQLPVVIASSGLALTGLGIGIGFTLVAARSDSNANAALTAIERDYQNGCGAGTTLPAECGRLRELRSDKDRQTNLATVGFVTAGVAAAGAVAAWLFWPEEPEERAPSGASAPRVVPVLTGTEGSLLFTGRF